MNKSLFVTHYLLLLSVAEALGMGNEFFQDSLGWIGG